METMKKTLAITALAALLVGCTSVRTKQVEVRYDPETGAKTAEIVTKASGSTIFEGEQALQGLKAEQSEGSQGFELTGLNQAASTTNLVGLLNAFAAILQNIPR